MFYRLAADVTRPSKIGHFKTCKPTGGVLQASYFTRPGHSGRDVRAVPCPGIHSLVSIDKVLVLIDRVIEVYVTRRTAGFMQIMNDLASADGRPYGHGDGDHGTAWLPRIATDVRPMPLSQALMSGCSRAAKRGKLCSCGQNTQSRGDDK